MSRFLSQPACTALLLCTLMAGGCATDRVPLAFNELAVSTLESPISIRPANVDAIARAASRQMVELQIDQPDGDYRPLHQPGEYVRSDAQPRVPRVDSRVRLASHLFRQSDSEEADDTDRETAEDDETDDAENSSDESNDELSDRVSQDDVRRDSTPSYAPSYAQSNSARHAGMTVGEFESLALSNNPTIRQLEATTRKAAGYREQVGYRSNPTIGYQGVQLADEGTDQHAIFLQKEIVTGGKLELSQNVLNHAIRSQNLELETQRQRIMTDVRLSFYKALAAQEQIDLATEFQQVMEKGLELAELRFKAEEGSKLDVLQARVQKNKVDLAQRQAIVAFAAAWKELAAVVGSADLAQDQLSGTLDLPIAQMDWRALRYALVQGSPEYAAALSLVELARTKIARQGVQATPNLTIQMAAGFDNSTDAGMLNLQIAAPLMINNQNHGNISAAQAEYCRAVAEVQRVENAIQARLAAVSKEYDSAMEAALLYQNEILPNARDTLDLAERAYEAGEFSFVEVLIVRRTFIESQLEHLQAKAKLMLAKTRVDGFLLTGGLDPVREVDTNDSLREQAFSQQ